jgi:hypothetical protein
VDNNRKKSAQLGMPYGTANGRLRKMILFSLLLKHGENFCYRCGGLIESESDLSVEHKEPWLDVSPDLFWRIDNIAFSHLVCNISAARKPNRVWPDLQTARRERSRIRGSDLVKNEHDKLVRRRAYIRGDNPNRRASVAELVKAVV